MGIIPLPRPAFGERTGPRPRIRWETIVSPHRSQRRRITRGVVVHAGDGCGGSDYAEVLRRYTDPVSPRSVHYVIDPCGRLASLVPEFEIAWHGPGAEEYLGIALAGKADVFGEFHYQAAAQRVRNMALQWGFPADRDHVLGHSDLDPDESDPGDAWDWDYFMWLVTGAVRILPARIR